jgi:Na+/serine symporter
MSFSISMPKTPEALQFDSLLVLTRTAIGLGIGMLIADKIKSPFRQAAAVALLSVGALAAVPFLIKLASEQIDRSEHGSRARLRSIRADSGFRSDTDAY